MYSKFRILSILSIIVLSLFISGCSEFYKSEEVKVKIIDIKPPRHFYLIVYDRSTGRKQSVFISKRCHVKNNLIGSETTILKITYIDKGTGEKSYSYSNFLPKGTYCN